MVDSGSELLVSFAKDREGGCDAAAGGVEGVAGEFQLCDGCLDFQRVIPGGLRVIPVGRDVGMAGLFGRFAYLGEGSRTNSAIAHELGGTFVEGVLEGDDASLPQIIGCLVGEDLGEFHFVAISLR